MELAKSDSEMPKPKSGDLTRNIKIGAAVIAVCVLALIAFFKFAPTHQARQPCDVLNDRGLEKQANGDLDGALADFNQAISLNPGDAAGYNNRGSVKEARGYVLGARDDYNQAIELKPGFALAYHNRARAKNGIGDLSGAQADHDMVIKLDHKLDSKLTEQENQQSLAEAEQQKKQLLAEAEQRKSLEKQIQQGREQAKVDGLSTIRDAGYDYGKRWAASSIRGGFFDLRAAPSNCELDRLADIQWYTYSFHNAEGKSQIDSLLKLVNDPRYEDQLKAPWSEGFKRGIVVILKPEIERFQHDQAPAF